MAKSIRNNSDRKSMREKLNSALEKKPTAQSISKKGLSAEHLNKILGNVPKNKHQIIKPNIHVKNGKIKRGSKIKRNPHTNPIPLSNKVLDLPNYSIMETPSWFTSKKNVDVSIIVPLYKSQEVIEEQIASWDLDNDGITKEIIYVDDFCPEKSWQQVMSSWEKRKTELSTPVGKIIINKKNGGFGAACNIGAKHALGRYLLFLNADIKVTKNWVKPMYDLIGSSTTIGIVGNMQLKDGDKVDSLGSEWDWNTKSFLHVGRNIYKKETIKSFYLDTIPKELLEPRKVEMVTGACFIIPRTIFSDLKGFDLNYQIAYWEDADLNMRVRASGYQIYCQPNSKVYHKVSHSRAGYHPFMNENRRLFLERWVDSNLIEAYSINDDISEMKNLKNESIVVYTAITGGYDALKTQKETATKDVEFIAFVDEPYPDHATWDFVPAHKEFSDPNRNAKIHKVMPHLYFPDKEYSLWMDGSVNIEFTFDVKRLIELYLKNADLAIFKHPERNCIYVEANTCIQRKLDSADIIINQVKRYTADKYPPNAGLVEATIILRRHTPQIIKFNEAWWEEIKKGSKRDQISFNYVAKKTGLKYNYFPGSLRKKNYLFSREGHNKKR